MANWTWFLLRRALVIPLLEITMDIGQRSRLGKVDWLADSPIGLYADACKRRLIERRYAAQPFSPRG